MKHAHATMSMLALSAAVAARTADFDTDPAGAAPPGWTCGTTGKGNPRWAVAAEGGNRRTLKYVDAPVARGVWHTLRVGFAGRRISVALDGRRCIEPDDDRIAGPGAVGIWTKADSATAFDDFAYGTARP